jgi:hypothetical protein
MPSWLVALSWAAAILGMASALLVTIDILRGHRQRMRIMNVVWPITALWAGPLGAWAYFAFGRVQDRSAHGRGGPNESARQPFPVLVAKGTTHCGSGCALGDVLAELVFLALPFTLFGRRLFGAWVYDYVAAFAFGVLFQYFTIKPMRQVSAGEAAKDALKADALSLTAWQLGMYGWMAIATFVLFHHELRPTTVVFWFMMQLGMLAGFLTSYPVNWALLRTGVKEPM